MHITKLSEYISFIEDLPKNFSLSRGQSADYPLLPSGLRRDSDGNRKFSKKAIRNFLEKFKIDSTPYINFPWDISSDEEWMVYAQHYGLPTKLMDFTSSHITSLLFAVEKAFQNQDPSSSKDAVVYFLNPTELNLKHASQSQIINVSKIAGLNNDCISGPIVVESRKQNSRINAQKGAFVLFQDDHSALQDIEDESILKKVTIDANCTKSMLSSLYFSGISFTHIYPELSSISKDILLQQDIHDFLGEDRQ